MSEGPIKQLEDVPKTLVNTAKGKPFMAIGVAVSVLVIVLIIEAWKPGLITGPIRSGLNKLGIKTA